MIYLSVAQASGRLGIDAKTLRRWLAREELPLEPHPHDGRKQGVSSEHLLLLARAHHRRLTGLPEEPTAPVAAELPAQLVALPQTLSVLQAQLAALQQQVAELSHRLEPHAHPSALSPAPVKPKGAAKRTPRPAPSAPSSRRPPSVATKPPRKPAHVIPLVEWESRGHYVVICPKTGRLPLEPDTPAWLAWLETQSSFRFVGRHGRFTAHREVLRVPNGAWRAHRHIRNHSYTLRLGPTQDLTMAVLEQTAATFQAHLK